MTVAGTKSSMEIFSLAKKSLSLTYQLFSAAPPIHWLSPIMRSHSLPFELSSLRKRSAKCSHGTNSNVMAMPVLAVKSFDSSARALAGSQAAQHRVSCLSSALAVPAATPAASAAAARHDVRMRIPFPPEGLALPCLARRDAAEAGSMALVGARGGEPCAGGSPSRRV